MKTCNDWLDAVKKRHELESDYALAKLLGVQQTNISRYRAGRGSMDAYTAARVAELLDQDPLKVIATAEAERARNDEQRSFWKRLAACVVLGTLGASGMPSPTEARTLHNGNSHEQQSAKSLRTLYIMRQRRGRRALKNAIITAGSSIHRAAVWLSGMNNNKLV